MKKNNYTPNKKLICDWTDEKKYLIHYRMLKFYVTHRMIVNKVQEVVSSKQSMWLEKNTSPNTQKRDEARNDFEKDFYIVMNTSLYGKNTENVRNSQTIILIKKDEDDKMVGLQSKLPFNGFQKSCENYVASTFKQNEALMDEPKYLMITVLEMSNLIVYETY